MNPKRARQVNEMETASGPILYWMSRDQRVHDNWALLFAQEMAIERGVALAVVFCLVPEFLGATIRHYAFMLKGMRELWKPLKELNIPFYVIEGSPENAISKFAAEHKVGAIVTDFDPLNVKQKWKTDVAANITVPLYEVDAHNIVPCWEASPKHEYGAYTIRPKLERAMVEFVEDFPQMQAQPVAWRETPVEPDWAGLLDGLNVDRSVGEIDWVVPGSAAALEVMEDFLETKLQFYPDGRNDPNKDAQSNLSPYLHFGQISAQRVALEVRKLGGVGSKEFLDELITWRELSDNFCYYNDNYTSFEVFPDWAKKSLNEHRADVRTDLYSLEQFELAQTHDDLWNASQLEMVTRGKMHGYMRMYWAKKILEWTQSPEQALEIAIYLNDKYEIDGRDPNGYANIAWAIGGVHDRPWGDRPVFGNIRYMSYNGCKSKFDVNAYISKFVNKQG